MNISRNILYNLFLVVKGFADTHEMIKIHAQKFCNYIVGIYIIISVQMKIKTYHIMDIGVRANTAKKTVKLISHVARDNFAAIYNIQRNFDMERCYLMVA